LVNQVADQFDGPTTYLRCRRSDAAGNTFKGRLEEALAPLGDGGLLVIDDAHLLLAHGPAIDELSDLLSSDERCVLVASREEVAVDLLPARLAGRLVELTGEDLRFRAWEVERLLSDVYGEPLPPEDVAALARRTQGWAACLQLFHLATKGKQAAERRRVLATLGTRSRLVREFLTRNVLDQLPGELRDFLVDASVLRRPTKDSCDALLGRTDSAQLLAELERRQLLLVRLDGDTAYDLHDLVRSYCLVELVERHGEDQVAARFLAAGRLLEAAEDLPAAFEAYVSAGDRQAASRVLGLGRGELSGSAAELVESLPRSWVESDPWLALARARRLLSRGRLAEAIDGYRQVAEELPPTSAGLVDGERRAAAMWADPAPDLSRDVFDWVGAIRSAVRSDPAAQARKAWALPGATGRLAAAVCFMLAGDVPRARSLLSAVAEDPSAHPLVAQAGRILATAEASLLRDPAEEPLRAVLALDESHEASPWLARIVAALAAVTDSDADRGRQMILQLLAACEQDHDRWGDALIRLLAGGGALRREGPGAQEWLASASAALRSLGAEVLACWADLGVALALTQRADPAAVEASAAVASSARAHQLWSAAEAAERLGTGRRVPTVERQRPAPVELLQPRVVMRCFGTFRLTMGGEVVDDSTLRPRGRSLLRLLAARAGRPVHREYILAALWPDSSTKAGLRSLQVAVSSIRMLLSGYDTDATVAREGEAYRLDLGAEADVDVVSFEAAYGEVRSAGSAGRRPEAAALLDIIQWHRAALLEDEGPAEWVVNLREEYQMRAVDAAVELASQWLDAGRPRDAARVCEWALLADHYRDDAWRTLREALAADGDLAASEHARVRYHQMLEGLGLTPGTGAPRTASTGLRRLSR